MEESLRLTRVKDAREPAERGETGMSEHSHNPATKAILNHVRSLKNEDGTRKDLIGEITITVTLHSGGGGGFGSDGTIHMLCGTVGTQIKGATWQDFTEAEEKTVMDILMAVIKRKAKDQPK